MLHLPPISRRRSSGTLSSHVKHRAVSDADDEPVVRSDTDLVVMDDGDDEDQEGYVVEDGHPDEPVLKSDKHKCIRATG